MSDRWRFTHGEELQADPDPPPHASAGWLWRLALVVAVIAVGWWMVPAEAPVDDSQPSLGGCNEEPEFGQ